MRNHGHEWELSEGDIPQAAVTFEEFIRHLDDAGMVNAVSSTSIGRSKTQWTGTSSFGDAWELMVNGWPEGLATVDEISADISAIVKRHLPEVCMSWDVTGSMVDVGQMLSGVPECMLNFNEQESSSVRYVSVHVGAFFSCGVSTKVIHNRGAAIVALIDALESTNHRVRLVWHVFTRGMSRSYRGCDVAVTMKDYQDPLDRDRVAFLMMHPSSYRRIGFRAMELLPQPHHSEVGAGSFYGRACGDMPDEILDEDADVVLGGMYIGDETGRKQNRDFANREAAVAWVLKSLEEMDVPLLGNQG